MAGSTLFRSAKDVANRQGLMSECIILRMESLYDGSYSVTRRPVLIW